MDSKEDSFHLGVKALIYNSEGKLLLLEFTRGIWDLPGGRMQKGESLEETLRREVYEETGLDNILQIIPYKMALSSIRIPTRHTDVGLICAAYLCHCEDVSCIRLSKEHVGFDWFEPERAAELLAHFPIEITEGLAALTK